MRAPDRCVGLNRFSQTSLLITSLCYRKHKEKRIYSGETNQGQREGGDVKASGWNPWRKVGTSTLIRDGPETCSLVREVLSRTRLNAQRALDPTAPEPSNSNFDASGHGQ